MKKLVKSKEVEMTTGQLAVLMMKQFDRIDKRFETQDTKFVNIDKRFVNMDKRFEDIDKKFQKNEVNFTNMNSRISHISLDLEHVRNSLIKIDDKISNNRNLTNEIDSIDLRVRVLEKRK